jgi:hypothetical protein
MTDHTPTPWRIGPFGSGRGQAFSCEILAEQGPVTVQPATFHSLPDAEYAVRAVNAHAELVRGLELLLREVDATDYGWPSAVAAARAALAKARGEQP